MSACTVRIASVYGPFAELLDELELVSRILAKLRRDDLRVLACYLIGHFVSLREERAKVSADARSEPWLNRQ
jgi:hypothetical protein